jgi:AraC-like DNA-binding protein
MDEAKLRNPDRPHFAFEYEILTILNGAIRVALLAYQGTGIELYLEHLLLAYTLRTFAPGVMPATASKGGLSPWAERQATAYMLDNLASKVQLVDLAQISGLSPHHFARMFKQSTGVSPFAYLIKARMLEASRLLTQSDLPVSEVAELVGYSSPSTFARLFKAEIGDSPLRYRQAMRQPPSKTLWEESK